MGIFDAFTSLFSKSNEKGKTGKRPVPPKGAPQKKRKPSAECDDGIRLEGKAEGRRKCREIHSDPIDEASLGFSISLKGDDGKERKRSAIRIPVKGLAVRIPRLKKILKVTDISATGLGFPFEKPRIKAGAHLKLDLVLDRKIVARDVICKVRRHEKGLVGCRFVDLDRAQDDAVSRMVLLGQKQMAERKKAKKDREFKAPS